MRVASNVLFELQRLASGGDAWCTWDYRWKGVSREGIDMVGNRVNEYRNLDHRTVLQWLYQQDTECAKLIDWLGDWWPELHPRQRKKTCLEIQGDVIRIALAALRGNRCFDLQSSSWSSTSQPALLVEVCELCRLVQYLDAAVDNGFVGGTRYRITKLSCCLLYTSPSPRD